MGIRKKAKKAAAAGVALATGGLSGCGETVVVDPPPPPLECDTVDQGQTLVATAERVDRALSVTVRHVPDGAQNVWATWASAQVTDPENVSVVSVVTAPDGRADELLVTLLLDSDTTSGASFALTGQLWGGGNPCPVSRTFSVSIDDQNVVVSQQRSAGASLPLAARAGAQIAVLEQNGRDLHLRAETRYRGSFRARWHVTGGETDAEEGESTHWRLPDESGLYQVMLELDYGADGLAVDTLILEVT
jgi:hypothetical protein